MSAKIQIELVLFGNILFWIRRRKKPNANIVEKNSNFKKEVQPKAC
jgi:hypothetical protein